MTQVMHACRPKQLTDDFRTIVCTHAPHLAYYVPQAMIITHPTMPKHILQARYWELPDIDFFSYQRGAAVLIEVWAPTAEEHELVAYAVIHHKDLSALAHHTSKKHLRPQLEYFNLVPGLHYLPLGDYCDKYLADHSVPETDIS